MSTIQQSIGLTRSQRTATIRAMTTFGDRYRSELDAIWASLARAGETHERVASTFTRDSDPRVVRLAQVTAFASALAATRAGSEMGYLLFPTLARSLPHLARPRPPATIVALTGDNAVVRLEAPGATMRAVRATEDVRFVTVWPMAYLPIYLRDARVVHPSPSQRALTFKIEGAQNVALHTVLGRHLRIFVDSPIALDLIQALRGAHLSARLYGANGKLVAEREYTPAVQWVRVDTEEPSLWTKPAASSSSDLFGDLVNFPESFSFFDLFVEPLHVDKTQRVEVTLTLAGSSSSVEALGPDDLRLGCAPAINVIEGAVSRTLAPNEHAMTLVLPADPSAEIVHVRRVRCSSQQGAGIDVPLYGEIAPGALVHGDVFAKVRHLPSIIGDRTNVELEFFSAREGSCPPPSSLVDVDVAATQRHRCFELGRGDVRGFGAINITRVMRGRPLRWGEEAGWRHHGFARMPASDLGRSTNAIEAFFALWDSDRRESAEVSEVIDHRVLSAKAARAHRLENGTIRHGLRFDIEMDPASFGSTGEAWLWGELLSRALAERESRLRFTELSWSVGELRAHFDAIVGRVWPGLFG